MTSPQPLDHTTLKIGQLVYERTNLELDPDDTEDKYRIYFDSTNPWVVLSVSNVLYTTRAQRNLDEFVGQGVKSVTIHAIQDEDLLYATQSDADLAGIAWEMAYGQDRIQVAKKFLNLWKEKYGR